MTTERTEIAVLASSWANEVSADGTGKFVGNGLRFATKAEAEAYGSDLAWRWTAVRDIRTVETTEPVLNVYKDGKLTFLPKNPDVEVDLVRQHGLNAAV